MAETFGRAEYAPTKKYAKVSRGGDGQVQCRKRYFSLSVNVNNQRQLVKVLGCVLED